MQWSTRCSNVFHASCLSSWNASYSIPCVVRILVQHYADSLLPTRLLQLLHSPFLHSAFLPSPLEYAFSFGTVHGVCGVIFCAQIIFVWLYVLVCEVGVWMAVVSAAVKMWMAGTR